MQIFKISILIITLSITMSDNKTFHKKLEQIAEKNNLIGMSVLVVCHNQVKDIYHYGYSNIERKIKVNDSTLYRIASISKTITATAIMQLFEKKLFKLDDDISDYLGFEVINPYFPKSKITFRMLLSHTSSLQDGVVYDNFLSASYKQTPPPPVKQLMVEGEPYNEKNIWMNKEPGSYFTYCNLNFGLLGTLVEKLSKQRFDIYVKNNILNPLNINGSFNVQDINDINNLATLYRNSEPQADDYKGIKPTARDLSKYEIGSNALIYSPQGGFRVSAKDLSKFMLMYMNDGEYNGIRIIDSSTVALMQTSQWKFNGQNGENYHNIFNEWGLGLHIITNSPNGDIIFNNTKMVGHAGDAYGLISDMYFDKNKKFGVIFITNGYKGENGFSTLSNSAFYKPEAEVFELVKTHFYKKCLK